MTPVSSRVSNFSSTAEEPKSNRKGGSDLGDNSDVAIGEMTASLAAHLKEHIPKARGTPAGEELLWVGRIACTSEPSGQGQIKIEQAVVAADRSMTASGHSDFCGIDSIRHLFAPLSRHQM